MKKFVVLSFVSLIILAFGSIVYGQPAAPVLEFKASGFIDAQTFWYKNSTQGYNGAGIYQANAYGLIATSTTPLSKGGGFDTGGRPSQGLDDGNFAFWESRARLKFDAVYGKDLSGTIYFEMDAQPWGNAKGGTLGLVGKGDKTISTSNITERNSYGYWSNDRAAVEIKNIYFDFGLPVIPIPITVRVGSQPFGLRNGLYQYTDGMGITAAVKLDPALISIQYAKPWEGMNWAADDMDMYGIHANVKVSTFTIGAYGQFWEMGTYPIDQVPDALTGLLASSNYGEMWWWGGYLDGKVGPVTLTADFIYDHGFVAQRAVFNSPNIPKTRSVRYDGWVLYGKGDFANSESQHWGGGVLCHRR